MLLKGAVVVMLDPPRVESSDLRVSGPRITEKGSGLSPADGEEVVDLDGAVLLPGLVNAHTHLYSTLARGLPPPLPPPKTFRQILERLWWRLDRALDEESVAVSALSGGLEAALSGTTVLIDHHSSPGFIRGSLDTVRGALEQIGLRSCLCYEVTDRNGEEGVSQGLEENVAFQKNHQTPLTRGMVGAHASLTLSEDTLDRLAGAVSDTGSSIHVHVGEDMADVEDCRHRFTMTLRERLERHGLIVSRAILAHCVHLAESEIEEVHRLGGWIAHNPRSNMNNAVGRAPVQAMKRAALGTDGVDQDMFAEVRSCYLMLRDAGQPKAAETALQLLVGGHRLAAALFGLPFGKLDAGAPADLLVLDYASPTPLHADNVAGHLLFGLSRAHVESVMVAGRWVVRGRKPVAVDAGDVQRRAREVAGRLWQRVAKV
jgi:putative selenium metabolism protein SsnA